MSGPDAAVLETMARLTREVAEELAASRLEREREGAPDLTPEAREALTVNLAVRALRREVQSRLSAGHAQLRPDEEKDVIGAIVDALSGAYGFSRWLADDRVEEIVVNRHDNVWIYYSDGTRLQAEPIATSPQALMEQLRDFGRKGRTERRFDSGSPRLNLQLPDGSRLFAIAEVTGDSPAVTIRRSRYEAISMKQLERLGTIDAVMRAFFVAAARARLRVVVSGETGAGKTTFIRAWLTIPALDERIIVIEDTADLNLNALRGRDANHVEMEVREANIEGEGAITQRDLVRDALRQRPDWLVVSETRGPEAIDMLNAMAHGQASISSIHAQSARSVPIKLGLYATMAPEQFGSEQTGPLIAQAVDLIVHMALDRRTSRRFVAEVAEVDRWEDGQVALNRVFEPGSDGRGRPRAGGASERLLARLSEYGFDHTLMLNPEGAWLS